MIPRVWPADNNEVHSYRWIGQDTLIELAKASGQACLNRDEQAEVFSDPAAQPLVPFTWGLCKKRRLERARDEGRTARAEFSLENLIRCEADSSQARIPASTCIRLVKACRYVQRDFSRQLPLALTKASFKLRASGALMLSAGREGTRPIPTNSRRLSEARANIG